MLFPCQRHFPHFFWRAKSPAYGQFNSRKEKPSQEKPTMDGASMDLGEENAQGMCWPIKRDSNSSQCNIGCQKLSREFLKIKINEYLRDVTATLCEARFKHTTHPIVCLGQEKNGCLVWPVMPPIYRDSTITIHGSIKCIPSQTLFVTFLSFLKTQKTRQTHSKIKKKC